VSQRDITVRTKYWTAVFSNRGAVATSWSVRSFPSDGRDLTIAPAEGDKLELIPQDLPEGITRTFGVRLPWSAEFGALVNQSNFQVEGLPAGQDVLEIEEGTSRDLVFTFASPDVVARKTFTLNSGNFVVDVQAQVSVKGSAQPVEIVLGPRIGDQSDKSTGTYSSPPAAVVLTREGKREQFLGATITHPFTAIKNIDHGANRIVIEKPLAPDVDSIKLTNDKGEQLLGYARVIEASADRHELTLDSLPAGAAAGTGVSQGTDTIRQGYSWIAVTDHYFAMVAVPDHPVNEVTLTNFGVKTGETAREHPSAAVPADTIVHVFVGPKDRDLLLAVGGQLRANLDALIDWGMFAFAVRPLIPPLAWSLKGLSQTFKNYGWAIVVITVVINILLSPLRYYSSIKMKKAAKHQPKLKELQERMKKLKDNPKKNERELAELQQQQVAIMKEANPLGGCMPLLLQMPIFWAVYLYLGSSLAVRHQPWFGWIHDLSKPDHLYILPILMCVTMIASTQLTPQPPATDPSMKMQRVMMTWLMPVMLTWFFFFSAPSGLVLYWMVSNIVGVLIQLIINKKTAHLTAELQAAMPGKTKSGGSDKPGKSGKSGRRRGNAEAEGF
jgi:YidC/Oxa1 family membrane protein insertase